MGLTVAGRRLEAAAWDGDEDRAALVLLHEGLGSVGLWRAFPEALAAATGRRVLAFSRFGHGRSDPPPAPRTAAFFAQEALDVLPAVLRGLGAERPILVGHSDGASIALIHAGARPVTGAVLIAPHVFVEPVTLAGIRATREAYLHGGLRERLARHHDDPDAAFGGWCDVWLGPGFERWELTAEIARLRAPTLLLQGVDDQYATLEQLDRIERGAPAAVARVELPARHSPHLEAPEETVAAIAAFAAGLG
ncbi:alpha/beta hydrolase [Baekduia soli]|uniref:Alpha/beta hydrolase n=1 Tax=Baekduia soli TaxID=496014 RepID=A0A5B8UDU2_9ACTN|nr:alpha/beta hydrolase [Baekduia soli]